jgi:hypothetical protein
MADVLEQAGKSHGVMGPVRRQLLETLTDFFE